MDKLTNVEKNVYINRRNEIVNDYSLGNLNYLKFYENIYINFFVYNVNDNLLPNNEGTRTLHKYFR